MAPLTLDDLSDKEQRILDEILHVVRENPGVLEHQLLSVLSHLDKKLIAELIDIACSSGLIERTRSGRMFPA